MANLRTNNLSGEGGRNAIKGSVFFGGGSDALAIPASSDFAYGTGDFTIEAWIWKDAKPATGETRGIYTQTQSGNDYIVIKIGSTNNIQATFGSTTISSTGTLAVNSWNHFAVSRSSNTVKVFLNGIASSGSTVSTDFSDTTRNPTIGNYTHSYGSLPYFGYISNLRVCKGHAVYTADFTPPSYELSVHDIADDDKTVLLCCQDSDNPLQEATGKTITGYGRYEYLSDTEVVLNGTFDTDTSSWTTQGDTVEIDSARLKIIRTGTFGAATQQVNTRMTAGTQYKFRGRIEQTGSPGSALLRLSSASNGNGTVFFNGAYGTGTHETIFTYSSGGGVYVSAIAGNGNVTGIWDDISMKAINPGTPPKNIPPFGVDAGNTFGGAITMNSSAWMYFPTGRTEERGRGRALLFVGYNPVAAGTVVSTVDFFSIQSQGNSTTFGSLSDTFTLGAAFSSSTRGIYAGGSKPAVGNVSNIDFFTIATTGNATDFGDIGTTFRYGAGLSNATRGIKAAGYQGGGSSGNLNIIEFVTIANTGNASDFGDTSSPTHGLGGLASPTRGVLGGGYPYPAASNIIEFITISTTGNTTDFGDLTEAKQLVAAGASNTRGIFGGGDNSGASKVINFITIATTGDAQDFGDLSVISEYAGMEMASNSSRMVFAGAGDYPAGSNTMEFINIATTGDATDFGDQTGDYGSSACSDSHGGLS
mgnify:CR=1 FL=1